MDEATDPTSGNVYYFNEAKGANSWDQPQIENVAEEEPLAEKPTSRKAPYEQLTAASVESKDDTGPSTKDNAEETAAPAIENVDVENT